MVHRNQWGERTKHEAYAKEKRLRSIKELLSRGALYINLLASSISFARPLSKPLQADTGAKRLCSQAQRDNCATVALACTGHSGLACGASSVLFCRPLVSFNQAFTSTPMGFHGASSVNVAQKQ